ncbi:hypothetical protein SAMN04244548_02975 [Paracoccus pantotrophus]|nr:hypothetical protein SAMN04244548_02975 [Paracoccus pantotrophus]
MKARTVNLEHTTDEAQLKVAHQIGKLVAKEAVTRFMRAMEPLSPQGKTISVSTSLCLLYREMVNMLINLDRDASLEFLAAGVEALRAGGLNDEIETRQIAAQTALARAEIVRTAQMDTKGSA